MVGAVTAVLLGSGIGYKVYADSVKKEKMDTNMAIIQSLVTEVAKEVNGQYDPVQKDFLKKDLSKDQLAQLKKRVETTVKTVSSDSLIVAKDVAMTRAEKDLEESFTTLSSKFETQTKLNGLFLDVTINGSEVKTDLAIKDDLSEKELEGINLDALPKKDKWSEAVSEIFVNAKEQIEQIKQATVIVDGMFQENIVKEDVSKEQIDRATKEIGLIRNEKAKTNLTTRLKLVTDELAKKEAETKAKVEEESKKVAEAQAASTGGTVVQNADGTYSSQAPATNESPQTASNNNQSTSGGNWNQGTTAPPVSNGDGAPSGNNNGGGGSQTPPPTNNNNGSTGGGNWTGTGNQTDGGRVPGGATGGEGDNSWTGGDFDGGGIDTSGWN